MPQAKTLPLQKKTTNLVLIGYIRVSTEQQKEGCSLEEQARRIAEYCQENGHHLLAIYSDAASGESIAKRPAFLQAYRQITRGEADGMIVWSGDRFSRDQLDSQLITQSFRRKGKTLISVSGLIDLETNVGRMQWQINQSISEYIRGEIVQRLYSLRMKKGEKGGWIGHRPPYGWTVEAHSLVEEPTEQMILRLMRRLKKWVKDTGHTLEGVRRRGPSYDGMTNANIAAYLNKRAETDPRFAPKTAKALQRPRNRPYSPKRTITWRSCVVRSILLGVCPYHDAVLAVCPEDLNDLLTQESQAS